jgi:hypothetical protein
LSGADSVSRVYLPLRNPQASGLQTVSPNP